MDRTGPAIYQLLLVMEIYIERKRGGEGGEGKNKKDPVQPVHVHPIHSPQISTT